MAVGTKYDGRREAGDRTRRRLLEAARALLAERDEDAVALRDITQAAAANVAAVSYHFGSKEALCRSAIEEAVGAVLAAQTAELQKLNGTPAVDDIAAALARPLVAIMSGPPGADRDRLRIAARVATDPPSLLRDSIAAMHARAHGVLLPLLRAAIPEVSDEELSFRASSVASIINCMAAGGVGVTVVVDDDLERMLVPVIAGALSGGPRAASLVA
jgi:AcrR family transcriptional regulator